MNTRTIAIAAVLMAGVVHSADLTLVDDSAATWDTATAVWTNTVAGGAKVKFSDGDNVLISSDYFTGESLVVSGPRNPGTVVFDISQTLKFGWKTSGSGLGYDTGLVTKRGSGTLLLCSDLSGSDVNAGGANQGNRMTNGVDIVEGEIACKNRNRHNFLGPRTTPYWVYVRNGASLSFLDGNQTGAADQNECGIKIRLEAGGRLNVCTNKTTASSSDNNLLCVNTLELAGGDIVAGNGARAHLVSGAANKGSLGDVSTIKIFNALVFSGNTPHAYGFADDTYPGYKHYAKNFLPGKISLNPHAPVEFRVDDIDQGDGVDAYVNVKDMFTWGTNTVGNYKSDIVKTGAGTICLTNGTLTGDFFVKEGTAQFLGQGFFPYNSSYLQTITVSTNATLKMTFRNLVNANDLSAAANVKIVVDHGMLDFSPYSGTYGSLQAKDWMFDDATLNIHNTGGNSSMGIFYFKDSVSFRGTRPLAMLPDTSLDTSYQAVLVGRGDGTRTVVEVADMTGDGRTDVTMGYHIWNGKTKENNNVVEYKDSGFVKTGAGTFAVASTANKVSGVVTVSNGTMRVDGSLVTPSSVEVASGAYLGGTGTVANVTLETGAGFAAPAGQTTPLTVQGDLALPATGVIDIANLDGVAERDMPSVSLVTATGTLSGTANLSNWTVKVNGVVSTKWRVTERNGVVGASYSNGLCIIFK